MSWVSSLCMKKITEYRDKWKIHLQIMEQTCIPLQVYKYNPFGRQGRPRRRWKEP
jgi:hypothetical protein